VVCEVHGSFVTCSFRVLVFVVLRCDVDDGIRYCLGRRRYVSHVSVIPSTERFEVKRSMQRRGRNR
jgi:hypothetical protein